MEEYVDSASSRQLTRRQFEALPYVLAPGPISEKAKNAGVSRQTLYRWLRNVNFRRTLQEATSQAMKITDSHLQLASNPAVTVLFRSLEDNKSDIRLRAAHHIVKLGHDSRFGQQVEERLSTIEDAIQLKEEIESKYS